MYMYGGCTCTCVSVIDVYVRENFALLFQVFPYLAKDFLGFFIFYDGCMAVKYLCKPKRNVIGGKDDVLYYASPKGNGKIDLDALAQELSEQSSLTKSDVHAAVIGLAELVEKYLHRGYRVKLDKLGVFYLSITSEGYEQEEACTPKKVQANKICFKADDKLRNNLKHVKFERG